MTRNGPGREFSRKGVGLGLLPEENIPDRGGSMKTDRSRRWVWGSLKTSGFLKKGTMRDKTREVSAK